MRMTFPNWPKDKRPVIHYQPYILAWFAFALFLALISFINEKSIPFKNEKWETHISRFYGYQLDYPESWARKDYGIAGTQEYPELRTIFRNYGLIPGAKLSILYKESSNSTLEDTAEWGLEIISQSSQTPDEISDINQIVINKEQGLTRTYTIRSKAINSTIRDVYFVTNDSAYILKFSAHPDHFETANQYYFEPILDSFVILDE